MRRVRRGPRTCATARSGHAGTRSRAGARGLPAPGDTVLPPVPRIPEGLSAIHTRRTARAGGRTRSGLRGLAHRSYRHATRLFSGIREAAAALARLARGVAWRAGVDPVSTALSRPAPASLAARL